MSTGQRALVVAALRDLFDSLELISTTHDEVFDTDVREDVARALNYYFVWGAPRDRFPRYFGMFTADGNQAVAQAVRRFVERTDQMAFAIPKGKPGTMCFTVRASGAPAAGSMTSSSAIWTRC